MQQNDHEFIDACLTQLKLKIGYCEYNKTECSQL